MCAPAVRARRLALGVKSLGDTSMFPTSPVIGIGSACGQYINGNHATPSGPIASPTGLEGGCTASVVGSVATLVFKRKWSTSSSADGVRGTA
jgi:hypothetical protein